MNDAAPAQAPQAATPAAPIAVTTPASPAPAVPQASPDAPAPQAPQGFSVPDAYKDKPWTGKVKSNDDLWKALDGAQELIGKKTLPPIDFKTAKPEDIAKFNETMRPADKAEYGFKELGLADDVGDFVATTLFENGIPAHAGKAVVQAYQKFEAAKLAEAMSAEGYKKEMSARFGEGYEAVVKDVVAFQKQHLSPESQKLFENLPNNVLAAFHEYTANIQKAFGAKETGAQGGDNKGAPPAAQDMNAVRAAIRNEIQALKNRPHHASEAQALQDKLNATYK